MVWETAGKEAVLEPDLCSESSMRERQSYSGEERAERGIQLLSVLLEQNTRAAFIPVSPSWPVICPLVRSGYEEWGGWTLPPHLQEVGHSRRGANCGATGP